MAQQLVTRFQQISSPIAIQKEFLTFGLHSALKIFVSTDFTRIDINKFQDAYDVVLGGLFDRQFGELGDSRELEFKDSLSFLKTTFSDIFS